MIRSLKFAAMVLALSPNVSFAAGFSHADWTAVLERFVDERGRVDYAALARDRSALIEMPVSRMSAPKFFPKPSRSVSGSRKP